MSWEQNKLRIVTGMPDSTAQSQSQDPSHPWAHLLPKISLIAAHNTPHLIQSNAEAFNDFSPTFPFCLPLPPVSLWHDRLFSCLWLLIIENFLGAFSVCIWKMYLKRKHFQLICQRHCSHKRKTATEFYLFILSMASGGSSCHSPSPLSAFSTPTPRSQSVKRMGGKKGC